MPEDDGTTRGAAALFALGLVVFLGSAGLFLFDVARGIDVWRSLGTNAVGAAVLIAWAAQDTLFDPDSEVATRGGALGTALLLYGLYLLGSGVVVAVTSLLHGRLVLGVGYVGLAAVAIVVGFLVFPTGAVVDAED